MAIEKFEVGKWYKWVGPKIRQNGWNNGGLMNGVFDGLPHECISIGHWKYHASFDCTKQGILGDVYWDWKDSMDNFEEVPNPNKKEENLPIKIETNTKIINYMSSLKEDWTNPYLNRFTKFNTRDSINDLTIPPLSIYGDLLNGTWISSHISTEPKSKSKTYPFKTKKEKRRKKLLNSIDAEN